MVRPRGRIYFNSVLKKREREHFPLSHWRDERGVPATGRRRFAAGLGWLGQRGKQSIGYLEPVLHQLPASAFNDIVPLTFGTGVGVTTLDSNEQYATGIPGMATTSGWDLTTGFGSPKVPLFVAGLAAAP